MTASPNEQRVWNPDSRGKLFELLVGQWLAPSRRLEHYRPEDRSPSVVRDSIAEAMSRHFGDDWVRHYSVVETHAEVASRLIAEVASARGFESPALVVWTSQPGDVASFTGSSDPDNSSDVMVRDEADDYYGVSLKYGVGRANLRNSSNESIARRFGADYATLLEPIQDEHFARLRGLGFTGSLSHDHPLYKQSRGTPLARVIEVSSLETRTRMVEALARHLGSLPVDELCERLATHLVGSSSSVVFRHETNPSTGGHRTTDPVTDVPAALEPHRDHLAIAHSGTRVSVLGLGGKKLVTLQSVSKGRPTKRSEWATTTGF